MPKTLPAKLSSLTSIRRPWESAIISGGALMTGCWLACIGALSAAGVNAQGAEYWQRGITAGLASAVILSAGFGLVMYRVRKREVMGARSVQESIVNSLRSEAQLTSLLQSAPIGLVIMTNDGYVVRTNRAFQQIAGLTEDECLGTGIGRVLHPDDRKAITETWRKASAAREPYKSSHRFLQPDGSVRWVECRAVPVIHGGGSSGYVAAVTDVTERVERDAELSRSNDELVAAKAELQKHADALAARTTQLETARKEAERANHAKSDFLANMSHEIRTPMTAIIGYGDMLLDPTQSPAERIECVQTIRRCGHHLLALINDILDLSKIEAGRLTPELIECAPGSIIQEVSSLLRGKALEKGIAFGVEFSSPVPDRIITDPTRLKQVLTNLVGNAIKFTESGGVRIVAQMVTDPAKPGDLLQVDVIDTGIGVKPDQLARLFEPFKQADESVTRRFGGTGLGLAICKNLAEILGGTITVDSTPGEGSRFSVTVAAGPVAGATMVQSPAELRARRPSGPLNLAAAEKRRLNGRVLLAEDGIDNQRLISMLLRRAGAEVVVADNGLAAAEAAAEAVKSGRPFGLILMDMQMPVLDGYSATSRLRSEGYQGPILALTAHAMAADRDRSIRAGCDDYLTKPIDRALLTETVHAWLTGVKRRNGARFAA
ncbi:MAG TPA: ATP-binding protein [Phycisphaerales bacterium]|nr:ATP-binding protein [Phycisphaerales bacterium]